MSTLVAPRAADPAVDRPKKPLLLRLGIAMASITALAVIGMLSSVLIAQTMKGFAAAINQAGTLRMQSYRIASSLVHAARPAEAGELAATQRLVDEYNNRLFSPRIHDVLERAASERVMQAYLQVERHWQRQMEPPLRVYLESENPDPSGDLAAMNKTFYLEHVDEFVRDIHHFVKVLELDAEDKNQQLHLIQLISLVLTLIVVFVSLYLTQRNVLLPLRGLLRCATAARRRDFSVRTKHLGDDELGQLGYAFNQMAEDLSKIYDDLEFRVREKTADLERSNRSLELLYVTTRRLSQSAPTVAVLTELIHDIEKLTGCSSGSICLGHPGDGQAYRLATTRPMADAGTQASCLECNRCLGQGDSHTFEVDRPQTGRAKLLSIPIRDQEQQFGALVLELAPGMEDGLEEWQQRLLETVASHIGIAINMARQASQSRMLSLQEERSVIARELHDSLAQSLSYLKIQVSRLDKSIREGDGQHSAQAISNILRKGLNGAYRQLRELLTTFRLRISEEGLPAALEDTVNEYRERSDIDIRLVNRIANCQFSPNAEIHILQIIREALSNVLRHANATTASVQIECGLEGQVVVLIEDDGVGLGEEAEMLRHYGLPIMKERAEWLGGTLEIGESSTGGTRVKLAFSITDSSGAPSHGHLLQGIERSQREQSA